MAEESKDIEVTYLTKEQHFKADISDCPFENVLMEIESRYVKYREITGKQPDALYLGWKMYMTVSMRTRSLLGRVPEDTGASLTKYMGEDIFIVQEPYHCEWGLKSTEAALFACAANAYVIAPEGTEIV